LYRLLGLRQNTLDIRCRCTRTGSRVRIVAEDHETSQAQPKTEVASAEHEAIEASGGMG
jgi:hypothetical protein